MEKFEYRNPRFSADLDARFTVDNVQYTGRCKEVSRAGMTLQVEEMLPIHSTGKLSLEFLNHFVEVGARVMHVEEDRLGLVFVYETDAERRSIMRLVEAVAVAANRVGPVLLP